MSDVALIATTEENVERWSEELKRRSPQLDIRISPDVGNLEDIEYAIVARPPKGVLRRCPNLKLIFSMWAGVEDLLADDGIEHIPIVRMTEPGLTNGIVAYVVHFVTKFHLRTAEYQYQDWSHSFHSDFIAPRGTAVGILGLGVLGLACAKALLQIGFTVLGYSANKKAIPDVFCYAGLDELEDFMAATDILVCLLPNTPATANMVNKQSLAAMKPGSFVINCGRGESIDDDALLECLRTGHIAGAVLDVFRVEPLPNDHPYWGEPNVQITPHCASKPDPETASTVILDKLERFKQGKSIEGIVDRSKAY